MTATEKLYKMMQDNEFYLSEIERSYIVGVMEAYAAQQVAEATKDCYPKEYTHWLFQGCPFLIGENARGRIIAYRVKTGTSMNLDELFDYWKNLKK
jgi:hypothetical protein